MHLEIRRIWDTEAISKMQGVLGKAQARCYDIEHAALFAERAGLLHDREHERPEEDDDGNIRRPPGMEEDERPIDEQPIPKVSQMAAAWTAFYREDSEHIVNLRENLIRLAREGALPSKRRIEKAIDGKEPMVIRLDCREGLNDPDIDELKVGRAAVPHILEALQEQAKAGSEVAVQAEAALREAIEAAREQQKKRDTWKRPKDDIWDEQERPDEPEPIELMVSARLTYRLPPTEKQQQEARIRETEERNREVTKGTLFKPSGWYRKKLIKDGWKG